MVRSLLIPLLIVLSIGPSVPVAAAADQPRARAPEDSRVEGPEATRITSPTRIKMAEGISHVVIDVKLNGQGPFRLILDTGAATTVLDADLVKELGLKSVGTTRIGDPSNPLANEVDEVVIDSVQVGRAHFTRVPAVGWRGPSLTAAIGARGVLGLPTFKDCLLTIDYPKREVEVAPGELPASDGRSVLPLTLSPIAEVPVDVAGRTASAHLDIGNASSLIVPGSWQKDLATKGEVRKGAGMRASGRVEFTIATLDGDLRIGEFTVHDPEVRFDDGLQHVNVGYGLLRRFAVTLDQRNGRLRLVPGAAPDSTAARMASPEGRRRLGAALGFRSDGVAEVQMVAPESQAAEAGLQAGDRILRVNGQPVSNEAILAALAGHEPIRLLVSRSDTEREVVLFAEGSN